MALRNRRLSIWSSLPPYLGGKRRLCPTIFREVDRILPRRFWPQFKFLDGFLGGGSVSLYAKAQGFRVIATDIAERAITVGEALIANSRVRLTREDVLRLAKDGGEPPGRAERFVPSVFMRDHARLLDRAVAFSAQQRDPSKAALYRLLAMRVAFLAHPMSQVKKGTNHRVVEGQYESISPKCVHHFVEGLRLVRPERLWAIAQQINTGVFQGDARVLKTSVLEALSGLRADVAYFDPPYPGVMSYEKEYGVLDEILEGAIRPTSPFTAKDGAELLDTLFARATHIPVWVLSLGNAVVSIEDLEAKMVRFGRTVRSVQIRYQHLQSVATEEKNEKNREFIVIGWDEAAVERLLIREPAEHATGVQLDDLASAFVHEDASDRGPVLAPFLSSTGDRYEQRQPALSEELGALAGEAVAKAERGLDHPHAIVPEAGGALDGERRV